MIHTIYIHTLRLIILLSAILCSCATTIEPSLSVHWIELNRKPTAMSWSSRLLQASLTFNNPTADRVWLGYECTGVERASVLLEPHSELHILEELPQRERYGVPCQVIGWMAVP